MPVYSRCNSVIFLTAFEAEYVYSLFETHLRILTKGNLVMLKNASVEKLIANNFKYLIEVALSCRGLADDYKRFRLNPNSGCQAIKQRLQTIEMIPYDYTILLLS